MYAVVDIETTGRSARGQKVTEIAILIHDGEKVIDEFQTLVNPETSIPYSITQLTGICDEMVVHSPKFYEVARKVYEMTDGLTFVAHNVSFDYGVLKGEFEALGGTFEREKLCTVKLSRKLLPGHQSYSLGKLCADLDIPIEGRHRAYGDAKATTILFEQLLTKAQVLGIEDLSAQKNIRIPRIPPLLSNHTLKELPTATGIYYFYGANGDIIYVGKANNIRQRVLSHFNDRSLKERKMFECIADIKFEITGSELIALLYESAEIKRLLPHFNHSQKRKTESHGLFVYENQEGVLQLSYGKLNKTAIPIHTFYSIGQAKRFIEIAVEKFELCSRYSGIENTNGRCFRHMIKKCHGVCAGKEAPDEYNQRVQKMIEHLMIKNEDFFIEEPGRNEAEIGIIQIKQGVYSGFGYVPREEAEKSYDAYAKYIQPQQHNSDTQMIIRSYLSQR